MKNDVSLLVGQSLMWLGPMLAMVVTGHRWFPEAAETMPAIFFYPWMVGVGTAVTLAANELGREVRINCVTARSVSQWLTQKGKAR